MDAQRLPQFNSFFMAGFECTASLAENRRRLDLLGATRHDVLVEEDYRLIKERGIATVREGLNWSVIDRGGGLYDFSRFERIMKAGMEAGIQQIWDLNHFDYPDWLDPFSEEFSEAFARYSLAAHQLLRKYQPKGILYLIPFNEISFFAWIGADMGWWAPYKKGQKNGFLLKKQLVKAAIACMDALWAVDSDIRFIHSDPFMRRLAVEPASKTALKHVKEFNEVIRFQAWDMLSGRLAPELGGDPKYLDIIGLNYYIHNQEWVLSELGEKKITHQLMDWDSPDRISFAEMLQTVYDRYQRPMIVSETGSFGIHRLDWWQRIFMETQEALNRKIPVCGMCAYPILDRPESAGFLLPNSGLWDFNFDDDSCERIPHERALNIIEQSAPRFDSLVAQRH
jgi:beta-glucosidase/6-phospho-beta-glucosidase/beta-galactosidase